MGVLRHITAIALVAGLAGSCAPEMCPGEVKAKPTRVSLATNSRVNLRKAKSSMIQVTKSSSKQRHQPVFTAKSTRKRTPPK